MNARADASNSRLDTVKLAVAVALLIGGIFAFYFFADYSTLLRVIGLLVIGAGAAAIALRTAAGRQALLIGGIFAFYFFADYSTLLRVIGLLVIGAGAAAIALRTAAGRQLWQFAGDSRAEIRKVVWPTRQETLQTTLVVIAMVLVLGILLWLFDSVLMSVVRFLVGRGG